jgi:hypothetical protein
MFTTNKCRSLVIYFLRQHVCAAVSVELLPGSQKQKVEHVTYALKYYNDVKQLLSFCLVPITEASFNLWPVMLQLCMTTLSINRPSSQNTPLDVQVLRYHNKAKQSIDSALFPLLL